MFGSGFDFPGDFKEEKKQEEIFFDQVFEEHATEQQKQVLKGEEDWQVEQEASNVHQDILNMQTEILGEMTAVAGEEDVPMEEEKEPVSKSLDMAYELAIPIIKYPENVSAVKASMDFLTQNKLAEKDEIEII